MGSQVRQATVTLYRKQAEFHQSPALFRAFAGGRGAGKSFVGAVDLLLRAKPGCTYLVGSPTGVMLNDTTLPTFRKEAEAFGLWGEAKFTPYPTVKLTSGAEVRFRTADNPDRMRGPNLSGAWLDEASLMGIDAFDIVIATLREGGKQGWLSATFTPQGPSHWTYDTFATGKPDSALFRARTGDNPFLPPGFEDTIFQQYGDTQFARQELGGEFVQIEGSLFPAEWFEWPGFYFDEWPENLWKKVVYLDPSAGRGTNPKDGDYQAYCLAGLDGHGTIYLDCVLNKEPVTAMIGRGFEICRKFGPVDLLGYEENGTMGFMQPEIQRQIESHQMLLPWYAVNNREPKIDRIRRLGSYLSRRQIRVKNTPGGKMLRAQCGDIPFSEHDDGPDAAAGAVRLLEQLTVGV